MSQRITLSERFEQARIAREQVHPSASTGPVTTLVIPTKQKKQQQPSTENKRPILQQSTKQKEKPKEKKKRIDDRLGPASVDVRLGPLPVPIEDRLAPKPTPTNTIIKPKSTGHPSFEPKQKGLVARQKVLTTQKPSTKPTTNPLPIRPTKTKPTTRPKKRKLTQGQLDTEIESFMNKDPEIAAVKLNEALDEYMRDAPPVL